MTSIADFDDGERRIVEAALQRRYGKPVETQPADVELRLTPGDAQLTSCPTLYWSERGAAFVVAKLGGGRWRAMFFYPAESTGEQYGAGRDTYDDLGQCVLAVLRVQADHEKLRLGVTSGDTAGDLEGPETG